MSIKAYIDGKEIDNGDIEPVGDEKYIANHQGTPIEGSFEMSGNGKRLVNALLKAEKERIRQEELDKIRDGIIYADRLQPREIWI